MAKEDNPILTPSGATQSSAHSAESSRPTPTISDRASRTIPEDSEHVPPAAQGVPEQDSSRHHEAPPPYSDILGTIAGEDPNVITAAALSNDGRVNISIDQRSNRFSSIMGPLMRATQYGGKPGKADQKAPPPYIPPSLGGDGTDKAPPSMNVVIHVVGSRGDVQPFVALGKVLRETYGHRVRLATHTTFKGFVEENGLEFFDIGGDPAELMAFMVKNPGLMPGFDSMRSGDVGKRRRDIGEMIKKCWRSCYEAGDGSGVAVSENTVTEWMQNNDLATMSPAAAAAAQSKPFVADCIIANPPSFAHIHCAEKLGIPLHIMFTMPWSPSQAFPHPLANIQSSNADITMTNYISYTLVDMLVWQGLGDVVNQFRVHQLGLEPISLWWAPGILSRLKVPHTYCWSPALIPRPADWAPHISISGFFFLSLASNYTPPPDLKEFLDAGPPPVYIGFGSIVVDDPNAMTKLIFEAVRKSGQRALVSKGWGGLGADELGIPDGVYMIGNCPHDWLFKRVSCVVHHGGAGTTAAGIACGKPTVVVPFFGDQPFWGAMVARAGAGPPPINNKDLTTDNLAEAIKHALLPSSLEKAKSMAQQISHEDGNQTGAQDFHRMLNYDNLRCSIIPSKPAVWRVKRTQIKLSALAAYTLAAQDVISYDDLKLYRSIEWEPDMGPTDPISGGATSIVAAIGTTIGGFADLPIETLKILGVHPDASKKKGKDKLDGKAAKSDLTLSSTGSATPTSVENLSVVSMPLEMGSETKSQQYLATEDSHSIAETAGSGTSASTRLAPTMSDASSMSNVSTVTTASSDKTAGGDSLLTPRTSEQDRGRSSSSMAEALRNLPGGSRPRSRAGSRCSSSPSRRPTSRTTGSSSTFVPTSSFKPEAALDTVYGTGKGLSKIIGAGLKSPMDFTMAITKGFHNVPRLYGEEVRQVPRVTGIQSGLRTAGKEFGMGLFDGISGLVTQPVNGAKQGGAGGFLKGIGKGIAGVVVKPSAAAYALPAYAMMGVYKEIQKRLGENVGSYIIAARVAQGYGEWLETDEATRRDIIHMWAERLSEVKGKGGLGKKAGSPSGANSGAGLGAIKAFVDKRKEKRNMKHFHEKNNMDEFASPLTPATSRIEQPPRSIDIIMSDRASQQHLAHTSDADDAELEEAIRLSLRVEEQQPAAAGIPVHEAEEDLELKRAITASLEQMKLADEQQEEQEFNKAIAESAQHHAENRARWEKGVNAGAAASSHDLNEDEQLRLALAESQKYAGPSGTQFAAAGAQSGGDAQGGIHEDDELSKALTESKKLEDEEKMRLQEEATVLEYVRKQSLAEEEWRKKHQESASKSW